MSASDRPELPIAAQAPGRAGPGTGVLVAGFVLAAASLVFGPLAAIPAIVVGILVITRGRSGLGATIITLAVVLPITAAVVVLVVFDAHAYRTPSASMAPTLKVGDKLITTKASNPRRGDILVFNPPLGADENACGVQDFNPQAERQACPRPTPQRSGTSFIKRVVAVGGDRVKIVAGRVYIDGRSQSEPFIRPSADCGICDLPREITIPKGYLFMLGDNRGESADSREWGPIPERWVVGKVRLRYSPVSDFGSP